MLDEPVKRCTSRCPEPAAPGRMALDLVVQYLQEPRQEADLRPDAEISLSRRQRLHRQPWRRPRRTAEEVSTLELVRRFHARHLAH